MKDELDRFNYDGQAYQFVGFDELSFPRFSGHPSAWRESSCQAREEKRDAPEVPEAVPAGDFTVDRPDALWVADFTQLTTWTGTPYVAVIADAFSRLCLGWSVGPDKTVEL